MLGVIAQERPDVVQTHLPRSGALARAAGRLSRTAVVSTLQSERRNLSPKECLSEGLTLGFVDGIISISKAVERSFMNSPLFRPIFRLKPRRVIPNAIDPREIESVKPSDPKAARREMGGDGELLLLNVASFKPAKGHAYLIRAVREARDMLPNLKLLIVGDGPLKPQIERLVKRMGLEKTVVFLGKRSDAVKFLWLCDIFVLPSVSEGLGLAAIEAMAAGRPVVATRVGGIPEAVRDGVDGLLVPPRDPEALARAIVTLARDEGLRRRMGEAGRRRAREEFSVEEAARRYEEFYLEILERRKWAKS